MTLATPRNPLAGIKGRKMRDTRSAFLDALRETAAMGIDAPGERFFFWLGQAAKELREEHDVRPEAIAARLGIGKETVTRFEAGRTRPHELELMLAAYAECVGLADPRDIVVNGVRKWFEHGEAPTLIDGTESDPRAVPTRLNDEQSPSPEVPADDGPASRGRARKRPA